MADGAVLWLNLHHKYVVFRFHWYLLSPSTLSLLCATLRRIVRVSQHGFLSYFSAVNTSSLFCQKTFFFLYNAEQGKYMHDVNIDIISFLLYPAFLSL